MSIRKELFGKTSKGEDVFIFTLENANGTIAKISTLGAVLVSLFTKDREGKFCDIVLGYDEVEQYEKNKPGFGATIGRNANRIRNASFSLNGKQYVLEKNDGNNNLHSGFSGYQHRIWEAKEKETTLGDSIEFCYHSLDKDQGSPGNLDVSVSYTLTEDDRLILHYKGTADEDTVLNMTNHSYFNLAGHDSGDVLKQKVTIYADYFTASDKEFIPTGEILSVKGTPMDFNISKEIGMDIESNYEAIVLGKGYDHNWILKKEENEKICLAAKMEEEVSGRFLKVYTDLPGMQFYTANFLDGTERGKGGCYYQKRSGACFESQYYPDSVNKKEFPSVILKAGEEYDTTTIFAFGVKEE